MFDKLEKTHYAALGAGVAVLIGLGIWLMPDPDTENRSPEVTGAPMSGAPASAPALPASGLASSGTPGLDPMSTKFDAARLFEIGYAGGITIDDDTQRKLAEILGSMGENPSDADMAKLERTLREGLPREDAEKALKLVKGYRGYVGDVRKDLTTHGIPTDRQAIESMFQRMQETQNKHFDNETAQALFGQQLKEGRIVMEAALVERDPNLSWDDKKARLDELRKQLPPEKANSIVDPPKPDAVGATSSPG